MIIRNFRYKSNCGNGSVGRTLTSGSLDRGFESHRTAPSDGFIFTLNHAYDHTYDHTSYVGLGVA